MKRARGFRCGEHQGAERPCRPRTCRTMVLAQSHEDRLRAIAHLAFDGHMEAIGFDGLSPSAALEAIDLLARSILAGDEWTTRLPGEPFVKWAPITPDEDEPEPESGHGRRAAKPSKGPKIVPATRPDHPNENKIQ